MTLRSVQLHRVFRTPPEKLYRAFLQPHALSKWLPPHGYTCHVHQLDAQAGGRFRITFCNFSTNHEVSFGGEYLELVPNERIRYTNQFEDPSLPGALTVSVTLRAAWGGTDLSIVQDGIPQMIPLEMCYLSWQESLAQLATLVEPNTLD